MILFHGTTAKRAECILSDRKIKKDCLRFFTKEENGDGYSTDGYVYLSNEITFSLSFAYSHSNVDESDFLYVFRIVVPDKYILADLDEMRHQDPTGYDRERYETDLECSLLEFKTCRIQKDISFDEFEVDYFIIDKTQYENISDLFDNAGYDYNYVLENYTIKQKNFINSIKWLKV